MSKASQKNYPFQMTVCLQDQLSISGLYFSRPSLGHYSNSAYTQKCQWCRGRLLKPWYDVEAGVLCPKMGSTQSMLVFYCRFFLFCS